MENFVDSFYFSTDKRTSKVPCKLYALISQMSKNHFEFAKFGNTEENSLITRT